MISIITPGVIAPLCYGSRSGQNYYFWQCLPAGRNFRRFNGTWAIVHSLLYGTVPSFPQRDEGGGEEVRDVSKVNPKQGCTVYVTLNTSNIFQTVNPL